MSRKRGPGRQAPRPWEPMGEATKVPPTDEKIAATRGYAEAHGLDPDAVEALAREDVEMWRNDRYVACVRRRDDGTINELSIRRVDRKPDIPWRHLQRIKNDICGDELEAVELFPAESRLVDTANQRWLWVLPPGQSFPLGFTGGRFVSGPEHANPFGAKQEAFE